MSTKKVTIQLNEADIVMLRRVAKEVKRKEQDMYQLLFAHGIKYMFCDESVSIKKLPDEYTQQEKDQMDKNKKLEKEYNNHDVRVANGWKHVREYISNHEPREDGLRCHDPLFDPIADRVEAFAL